MTLCPVFSTVHRSPIMPRRKWRFRGKWSRGDCRCCCSARSCVGARKLNLIVKIFYALRMPSQRIAFDWASWDCFELKESEVYLFNNILKLTHPDFDLSRPSVTFVT